MLRVDNGSVLENSNNINYAKLPEDKCVKRRDEFEKVRKASCDKNADEVKELQELQRRSACQVHYCTPTKTCMAKVGLHDSNGNFLTQSLVSANVDGNLRINNQIGYVYQEKRLADTDALINALRNQNPLTASVAQKIQISNNELFGKPHAWDGPDTGHHCPNKCPPAPSKPCPARPCKKADPLFNPGIGIGSDGLEAKEYRRDFVIGRNFQERLETATQGVQAVATMATMATGETLRGQPQIVGKPVGRPQTTSTATTAVGSPRGGGRELDIL